MCQKFLVYVYEKFFSHHLMSHYSENIYSFTFLSDWLFQNYTESFPVPISIECILSVMKCSDFTL